MWPSAEWVNESIESYLSGLPATFFASPISIAARWEFISGVTQKSEPFIVNSRLVNKITASFAIASS